MLPERLRQLRKAKKLTMKELGKKFNLAESTISGYENGIRKPDIELVERFASFFGVSTDYLLGRTDYPQGIDLTNKSEEEKNKIYDQFVIEKADEPIKFRGKELTPEQLEYLNKALNIINELPPEKIKHIMKATDLAMEAFKIAEKENEKEKGET